MLCCSFESLFSNGNDSQHYSFPSFSCYDYSKEIYSEKDQKFVEVVGQVKGASCVFPGKMLIYLVSDDITGGKAVPVSDSFSLLFSSKVAFKCYNPFSFDDATELETLVRSQQERQLLFLGFCQVCLVLLRRMVMLAIAF